MNWFFDHVADYICGQSYATYTRINTVGTKVQFAFPVPVSGLIPDLKRSDGSFPQASCNWLSSFPSYWELKRPNSRWVFKSFESGKTFRHKWVDNQPYILPLQTCIVGRMHFQIGTKNLTKKKFIVEPSFITSWTITGENKHGRKCKKTKVCIYLYIISTVARKGRDIFFFLLSYRAIS